MFESTPSTKNKKSKKSVGSGIQIKKDWKMFIILEAW